LDELRIAEFGTRSQASGRSGSQDVVGLTLVGARALLKLDGRLIVTVPRTVEASSEVLAGALGPV
jgi:hypothetical protein